MQNGLMFLVKWDRQHQHAEILSNSLLIRWYILNNHRWLHK